MVGLDKKGEKDMTVLDEISKKQDREIKKLHKEIDKLYKEIEKLKIENAEAFSAALFWHNRYIALLNESESEKNVHER